VLSLLSVVVTAREADRFLVDTLAHAGAQTHAETEILVVDGGGWPDRVRHLLEGAGGSRPVRYVAAPGGSPGAMRNAGVRASIGSYVTCVDCGELLEPRYGAMATAALHADPRLGFVGANEAEADPFVTVTPNVDPTPIDLATALRDPFALPGALTVPRDAWAAVGGFDEALDGLETYDLCLRLLARGYQGLRGAEALVRRAGRQGGGGRWRLDPDQYARTVRAILGRHEVALGQHAQATLYELERGFRDLLGHHRRLVQRRDDLVAERTALQREAERLTETLRATGETGFDWGDLRWTHPVSRDWGYERGQPLDRYYIKRFLAANAGDVRGRVLEVQEAGLTEQFGAGCVTQSDVVDLDPGNPKATIIADLRCAPALASDVYDCVILTQTLHSIDDMSAVLAECVRILRPGGVLLATLPAASRVCLEYGPAGDFWRVTEAGARALFATAFMSNRLDVRAYGNVLANVAFLEGLTVHELTPAELDVYDPYFPLIVGVRAVKPLAERPGADPERPGRASHAAAVRGGSADAALILHYHQVAARTPDVHRLAVSPAEFRAQMVWLQRHCRVMPLAELAESVRTRTIPPGTVAVTFDDGYADNLEVASPILADLGLPATFFVLLPSADGASAFWWDTLEGILLGDAPVPPVLETELDGAAIVLPTRTADERLSAYEAVYPILAASASEPRDAVIRRLLTWAARPVPVRPDCRRLAPSDLVRLAGRPGHAIGAHGVQHLRLPLQPPEIQHAEIEGGRLALSRLLGRPIIAFAYPFGDHGEATVSLARDAGFALGVTCVRREVRPGDDLLRLPRIEVGHASLDELAARLQSTLGVATG
jgi:peptidoglycan/xylan/chitin deacetylase (PgdA/CDA1 family)/SAM-dependent methyltransferase